VAEPAVKTAALGLGLAVYQPKRVREPEFIETLRGIGPDAIIVAAYGQILPKEILALPKYGCINIHASLLPLYRGAAPINWAVIRGERETGITIMQMDEGMDTGAVFLRENVPIGPKDTAGTLTGKLSLLGAKMIAAALPLIETGKLKPVQQDHAKATLAPILKKEDGLVDWTRAAEELHNRVRGLSPWPGAYTFLDGKLVKLIETETVPGGAEPGLIRQSGKDVLDVGTGDGMLRILRIQPEGKKIMTAGEFLRGHRDVAGKKFGKS
jgi:methionyl-tRNA formyltransferase